METNFVEWEHIRRHGGRMRYAPTLVRLWWYAVGLILDVFSWAELFGFNWITVGAYRIRPYFGERGVVCRCKLPIIVDEMCIRCHGGRMRYAPTLVRLWGCAVGLILGVFSWVELFEISRITVGAYRIRPHVGESDVIRRWMVTNFVEWECIRRHGGRMRYAPTHVWLWWYAVWPILDVFSWFHGLNFGESDVICR